MSTAFQNSIQTLSQLHEKSQQKVASLQSEVDDLQAQLDAFETLLGVSNLQAVRERAESEKLSVDAWLKSVVVAALEQDVRAIYVDQRVYDKLSDLAEMRGIDVDMLLTRSSTTEFLVNAIQSGRL